MDRTLSQILTELNRLGAELDKANATIHEQNHLLADAEETRKMQTQRIAELTAANESLKLKIAATEPIP